MIAGIDAKLLLCSVIFWGNYTNDCIVCIALQSIYFNFLFAALSYWPTASLEDLMTMALLEEKVEFVKLFVINGLVISEYLTVSNLRHLYNESVSLVTIIDLNYSQ